MEDRRARRLTVSGAGRAVSAHDVADVVLGVEIVRPTAGAARDDAAVTMARVVDAVRATGIGDHDLRTARLALGPELEYRPDGTVHRIGFRLTNRLTARVRDLDQVSAVVDAAIGAGATSLDGVEFRVVDHVAARRQALADAVADARAAAESLADAAGVALGEVLEVSEGAAVGSEPVPSPRLAMLEAKAADTPVLAGMSEVEARVLVTWAVAPRSPAAAPPGQR